jgi:hypothetical protein
MARFLAENVPNGELEQFYQDQRDLDATDFETTDNGDGTSNVVVIGPDEG